MYKAPVTKEPVEKESTKESTKDTKDTKGTKVKEGAKGATEAKKPNAAVEVKKESKAQKNGPAVEKKEPKAPAKAEPNESTKPKDAKPTSSTDKASPFRLAAVLQTEKDAGRTPPAPAKSESPANPAAPAAKPAAPAKAETPAAKEQPKAKELPKPTEPKPAAKPAAAEKKPEKPAAGLSDKLKDRIRRDIAGERIQKVFDRLRKMMDEYQQTWSKYNVRWIRAKDKNAMGPPPPEPDFKKLAAANGLSAGITGLVTDWQVAANPEIGASLVDGRTPVAYYAYKSLAKFHSARSYGVNALYLFWKIEDEKEHTPKLDDKDVRQQVVYAWKLIEARKLAKKAAEELADKARKAGKPLKDVVSDRPGSRVVLPPAFSWMTKGNVAYSRNPQAELSRVAGVDMPGDEFMRAVFRLEPGQIGTAFNAPQTVVYVVRPSEFAPSYDVRWREFAAGGFREDTYAGAEDQRQLFKAWLDEIEDVCRLQMDARPQTASRVRGRSGFGRVGSLFDGQVMHVVGQVANLPELGLNMAGWQPAPRN